MSFVGDIFSGLFGGSSQREPQTRQVTTKREVGPPVFSPETEGLLDPLSTLAESLIGPPEGVEEFQDLALGALGRAGGVESGGVFEPARENLNRIFGGFFDPTLNPAGFEAAFSTAASPLIRSFQEDIVPTIRSAATRAGVPQGGRVGTAIESAGSRLLQSLEDLAGGLFASERRFGGNMLSRALGLAPTYENLPFATEQSRLGLLANLGNVLGGVPRLEAAGLGPAFKLLGLTRGGVPSTVTEPAFFPSPFERGMDVLGGLTGVGGGIAALGGPLGFGFWSTEEVKKDISEPLAREDVLEMIRDIPVRTWRYKWEEDDTPVHIGPIVEDLPKNFRRGPFLDLSSVLGGTVLALQDLDDRVNLLEV